MPGGRPSKFDKSQEKVKTLAERGFTDKEIAFQLDITEQTFNNWKVKHPKFFEALKDWKEEADRQVERSLYERAHGYQCKETKVFCQNGEIIKEDVIKHYAPDPTSMIFWLKNRKRKEWRDKQEIEHDHTFNVVRKEYK